MPSGTNSYAFCADYTNMAECLLAIKTSEDHGDFAAEAEILRLLYLLENDLLRKLYLRTVKVAMMLDRTDGNTYLGGDFDPDGFSADDFYTGYLLNNPKDDPNAEVILGDYQAEDFLNFDFHVGYPDPRELGYAETFQFILNQFKVFCSRQAEINEAEKEALNAAFIPFADAFNDLQQLLISKGLNPCTAPERFDNSPGVYLQAAGSDGLDGIAEGIHLRWSFTAELGSNHLPKGGYYNDTNGLTGYNKPDDYVQISRIPYVDPVVFTIDFEQDTPVVELGNGRWTYIVNQQVNGRMISNRIRITFVDVRQLMSLLMTNTNAIVNLFDIWKQYNGLMVLEVLDRTLFKVGIDFRKNMQTSNAVLKVEALCTDNISVAAEDVVRIRKTIELSSDNAITETLSGENMKSISLKKSAGAYLQTLSFETYYDFLTTRNAADWTPVGDGFSLSLNDQEVFDRLENAAYPIDNLWPQYNNGTRVKVANYQDKWSVSRPNGPSLKAAVSTYLTLSETDPRAEDIIKDDGAGPEDPGLLVSYLDLLVLQALDYHMARMLGFGHIDVLPSSGTADQFVYRLSYTNRKSLNDPQMVSYTYMSLPLAKTDQRLPEKPLIRPVKYGLPVNDGQISTVFDEQGYTKIENIRAVNIGRELFIDEVGDDDFFANDALSVNSNIFEHPKPVFYGLEYRPADQSAYVKPEISNAKTMGTPYYAYDDDFPVAGVLETVPVLDNEISLYIHLEQQRGIHYYAIYGINWFARASATSEEAGTDDTAFPIKNSLVPPTDFAVQYIQKEDTLLFTTALEQAWLKGRTETFPGQDTSFTRLTFNWLDITDVADTAASELMGVLKPDKAKVFFKPDLLVEITGIVRNIQPVAGSDTQLRLYTGSYVGIDGTVMNPSIAPSDFFRFTDSLLSTPDGQYRVLGIEPGADWPVIVIEKAYDAGLIDDDTNPGNYVTLKTYSSPEINSRFSMVENLSNQTNWEPVAEDVLLFSFADPNNPNIEESTDSEGTIFKQWIGGITGNATVSPLFTEANTPDDLPGYYKISFEDSVILAPHPQVNIPFDPAFPDKNSPDALCTAHVEWYKGWVRMSLAGGGAEKKLLEVLRIDQISPLTLYIYDPSYLNNPIADSAVSEALVSVNFHPGYKVYLFPEPAPAYTFNGDNIYPVNEDNTRKTLLGLQSADTRPEGTGFVSKVSMPAVLLARKIEEALQFDEPLVPGLKVRPDATGKAAFTFDIRVAPAVNGTLRKPFGFAFYRTTHEDVLDALYSAATVSQILADLDALETDPAYDLRYYELVNLIFDPAHPLQFRVFEAEPQPYGFPVPDRAGLVNAGDNDAVKLDKYRLAIHETLLPLTEQTPILSFIKQGYQTENKLPSIRDLDGNLLSESNPAFNPFPMIRRYTRDGEVNATYIRFTDYILNASSRNLYFYAGTEVTSQLVPGSLSLFAGPVTVLHTAASDAPLISKFTVMLPPVSLDPIAVVFQLAPMQPSAYISKIRVYRTTDALKVNALQTMESHFDVEIEEGLLTGYEITDDFHDLTILPLGETIYYRFAGIRTIINEFDVFEDVFSLGSAVVSVKLIDTVNPDAPDISYDTLANKLSWEPTTNKGTYYLYKQNIRGNWERIYTVEPPATAQGMEYELPAPLVFEDDEGNRIYYRFKVQVQNSSGLFNLTENEVTI